MKTENEIVDILYKKYQNQGFITEQAIFDLCDDNSLSFIQTDRVCGKLQDLGVLIKDSDKNNSKEKTDIQDYSQIDYGKVYSFFLDYYPQMKPVIEHIKNTIPPQKGEVDMLFQQMKSGNQYARKRLIEMHLRAALRATMNYDDSTTVPLEEIFSVACDGLISAVDSYDPYSNSYFASYASLWMKQRIDRYIIDNRSLIRIPVHAYSNLEEILKIIENCTIKEMKKVQIIESELGISEKEAREWLRIACSSEVLYFEDFQDDYESYLPDNLDIFEIVEQDAKSNDVMNILDKLTLREKNVLVQRYGLIDNNCKTLEEIGEKLSVTRERIRQIEAKALRKMRLYLTRTLNYQ